MNEWVSRGGTRREGRISRRNSAPGVRYMLVSKNREQGPACVRLLVVCYIISVSLDSDELVYSDSINVPPGVGDVMYTNN